MTKVKMWTVDDPDLPEELHLVRKVFSMPKKPLNTKKEGEGLHDYFMRKGIKCFCPSCRKEKQQSLV